MAAKRKRAPDHEEHENHERWLITYADMITLLMVLFIVLFSISQVDLAKFEKFKAGLSEFGNGTGESLIELEASGVLTDTQITALTDGQAALDRQRAHAEEVAAETARMDDAQAKIVEDLRAKGLEGAVRFRTEQRGLIVTIVTDRVLFEPGSDVLTGDGAAVIDALSSALAPLPNLLSIEGHTDSVPISTARFPSNWELSTARATSVLRALIDRHAIAPERLAASGYADQRPLASNDTAVGRASNRRVEIVIHTTITTGAKDGATTGTEAET